MEISAEAKKRLAVLIEERDAPLAPLAARIGVSQSTLWNFIYGQTKNFSKIHRLATELKVSLDWIIGGDAPAVRKRPARRLSEHLPDSNCDGFNDDRYCVRETALAIAAIARTYADLGDDAVGAIALALWEGLQAGDLPLPPAGGKPASKATVAEAHRLALYEMGKLRRGRGA